MELKLHLKAFNQKVWASMFEQCLQILVKKSLRLWQERGTLFKRFSSNLPVTEDVCKPLFCPPELLVMHFPSAIPFLLVYPVAVLQEKSTSARRSTSVTVVISPWDAAKLFSTCAKFSNVFLLSTTKITLTVGVSNWSLLICKPWWLSLGRPYFVQRGAYAYM